jgi:hypothetical protein
MIMLIHMWVLQHILEDANASIKLVARKKNMKNITIRNVKIYVKNVDGIVLI